jgi:hypothetical protein
MTKADPLALMCIGCSKQVLYLLLYDIHVNVRNFSTNLILVDSLQSADVTTQADIFMIFYELDSSHPIELLIDSLPSIETQIFVVTIGDSQKNYEKIKTLINSGLNIKHFNFNDWNAFSFGVNI